MFSCVSEHLLNGLHGFLTLSYIESTQRRCQGEPEKANIPPPRRNLRRFKTPPAFSGISSQCLLLGDRVFDIRAKLRVQHLPTGLFSPTKQPNYTTNVSSFQRQVCILTLRPATVPRRPISFEKRPTFALQLNQRPMKTVLFSKDKQPEMQSEMCFFLNPKPSKQASRWLHEVNRTISDVQNGCLRILTWTSCLVFQREHTEAANICLLHHGCSWSSLVSAPSRMVCGAPGISRGLIEPPPAGSWSGRLPISPQVAAPRLTGERRRLQQAEAGQNTS